MKNNISLAEFISTTREKIGLSQKGLAKKSDLDLSIIEKLESGQELFLSVTIRQKLAKGLKIDAKKIKTLEKYPDIPFRKNQISDLWTEDKREISQDYIEELKIRILEGHTSENICPVCKSELVCRIAIMYDLEDNLVKHPKARCSKCPFQIR